jgi:hypothetical protein
VISYDVFKKTLGNKERLELSLRGQLYLIGAFTGHICINEGHPRKGIGFHAHYFPSKIQVLDDNSMEPPTVDIQNQLTEVTRKKAERIWNQIYIQLV